MPNANLSPEQQRLLDRLLDARMPASERPAVTIRAAAAGIVPDRVPLSFAQRRIWFFEQIQPGSPLYFIVGGARLRGTLDRAALQSSLDEVVHRHESLRTTYHVQDGTPWARIEAARPVQMTFVDLSGLPADERDAAVEQYGRAESGIPFRLDRDQLIRTLLLKLGSDEHRLVLSMHHIAADGWSLGVLIRDLAALYRGFHDGVGNPLAPPRFQYRDFSAWQHEFLAGPELSRQLGYWSDRLTGAPLVELRTDRSRLALTSFAGDARGFALPAAIVDAVRAVAESERATPFMVLLTAFAATLGRWSGQDDIVVGAPVANRRRTEAEDLVGFFVNTLAVRLDQSGPATFRELIGRAREECLAAFANQDVPFERVVEELQPDRELSAHSPFVRHSLVLHNTPTTTVSLPGVEMEVLPLSTSTAKFDLQVELTPQPDGGMSAWVEYSAELFDAATIDRLMETWTTLLAGALADPDAILADLPLRLGALADLPALAGADLPPAATGRLTDLVLPASLAAALPPETVAITSGATSITYRELGRRADRLARRLRDAGGQPEQLVGVYLPRGINATVAMLGTVRAGLAYVPLEPGHPAARTAATVHSARPTFIVTDTEHVGPRVEQHGVPVLVLDDLAGEPVAAAITPTNTAYVIFTSGSTGAPKGAINQHDAVSNRIQWMQDTYRLTPYDVVLHKTPLGFDVSGWEWMWPLAVGARMVVAEGAGHKDPGHLVQLIRSAGVTTCHFVPSMLSAFLEHPDSGTCASTLRQVFCSGEELPVALVNEFQRKLSGVALHNLYGPTEAAIDVSFWAAPPQLPVYARVPIGRPIAGARLYVLDNRMRPVPVGVPGELYIGGLAVGRGYHGRPGLTADRFVPDPFPGVAETGRRLYRTGDGARWLGSGDIEFLGRLDDQLKVNGQRLEPAEVELAIGQHPLVSRALVTGFADRTGSTQLAAYVSFTPDYQDHLPVRAAGEHVDRWARVFDETYQPIGGDADEFAGWISSHTGEPIPREEMRTWVDETVDRIRSLNPARILEIGCGTGLLLRRLAPHCEAYVGTDIAATAIEQMPRYDSVTLHHLPADDVTPFADQRFDAIVMNSVVQYFPDADYLARVTTNALRLLAPGGHLFIGDVRSLPLLPVLETSVLRRRAGGRTALPVLRSLVAGQVAREEELAVHPDFFASALASVTSGGSVSVLPKASPFRNELSMFRYDVVISPDQPATVAPERGLDWSALAPGELEAALETGRDVTVRGVLDDRLRVELAALRLLADPGDGLHNAADLSRAAEATRTLASEPAALAKLAADHGYTVGIVLSADDLGRLDVMFRADGTPGRPLSHPRRAAGDYGGLTNNPRRSVAERAAVATLREHAQRLLPDYMVPVSFVVLTEWPVGHNGKLDRTALPPPQSLRPEVTTAYVAPRTSTERAVAAIWRDVLGVEQPGIHDDFFAIGGHSLLATQVVARLRTSLGREVALGKLFSTPTIAALAAHIDTTANIAGPSMPRLARRARTEYLETPRGELGA